MHTNYNPQFCVNTIMLMLGVMTPKTDGVCPLSFVNSFVFVHML